MTRALILSLLTALLTACPALGQRGKMSAYVRQIASNPAALDIPQDGKGITRADGDTQRPIMLCTLVKVEATEAEDVFSRHECQSLAHWGDIHIVMMPLKNLRALAAEKAVARIETSPSATATMDSTAMLINTLPVYAGQGLPQAYTGQGIIMGLVDIGFDLTHPNFFSPDMSKYRINRIWDQIAPDSTGTSTMPVGREIVGEEQLLSYGRSYDGLIQTHGTHTLGIAAGSGCDPWHMPAEDGSIRQDSLYRGIAWESDICLVANATSDDISLIDSTDYYKYTTATDLLAFKYVFDYAAAQHRPCVLSFSEGSPQYFDDDQQLYYAVLDSLTGPGRIMVASAGNRGLIPTYLNKPRGKASAGGYLRSSSNDALVAFRSRDDYSVRMTVYADMEHPDVLLLNPLSAFRDSTKLAPDSLTGEIIYTDSLLAVDGTYVYKMARYASTFNEQDTICEMLITSPFDFGNGRVRVSLEVLGEDAAVECFVIQDKFMTPSGNYPDLNDGELTHSVMSPGSAPSVICVGSTCYRKSYLNFRQVTKVNDYGENGFWSTYSSVGPTIDGRTKPDVLAPGTNIISSFSSYYYENNNFASGITATVKFFEQNGRKYLWTSDMGTSMATPVVAGAIALWLQACPTLTPEDVMDALAATSKQPDTSLSYPNNYYGYGIIDVYYGLLHVLGLSGITDISHTQPSAVQVRPGANGTLKLTLSGNERPDHIKLYDLSGRMVWQTALSSAASTTTDNGTAVLTVRPPALPKAVYAIQLHGPSSATHGSTLVRIE